MTGQPEGYLITKDELNEIEKRFNDLIASETIPWDEDCLNTLDDVSTRPLRQELCDFAREMESTLKRHDGRTWKDWAELQLFRRLQKESEELLLELLPVPFQFQYGNERLERIKHECIDVANYAMMIYDIAELRKSYKE